uniref:Uncharacterized protein n=1 Tax=Rhizophora mucronata TaxID=61149 RepID=A0A2P2P610_RHIMU
MGQNKNLRSPVLYQKPPSFNPFFEILIYEPLF